MKLPIYDKSLKVSGELDVTSHVLPDAPNRPVLYEIINAYLANQREGNASTKNRKAAHGTTAKMYRQKGTGRARHGSAKAGIFVGGGQIFGPAPRDYTKRPNKKNKTLALKSALSARAIDSELIIIDEFPLKEIKTKLGIDVLKKLGALDSIVVTEGKNEGLMKALGNIPHVEVVRREDLNAYSILKHKKVVFLKNAWNEWQKETGE